jgi:hypothetical protein
MKERKMNPIIEVLMNRDRMTYEEALASYMEGLDLFNQMIDNDEDPSDICEEQWGLEPDYLDWLIADAEC